MTTNKLTDEQRWCPDVDPITRYPLFMWISHPELGYVPTYGGPYDSYTLTERDENGEFFRHRYDHDRGGWVEDEYVGLIVVEDWLPKDQVELDEYVRDNPTVELQERRKADSEPVGWSDEEELRDVEKDGCGYLFKANPISPNSDPRRVIKLYRHSQTAQEVPDDLLSMAASAIEDLLEHTDPSTSYYSSVWADVPGKLRAAIQSFGNSEQLDEVGSWNNHINTPTAKPAIDTGELLKHIEGMEVSVDVSTCDADAGHRYFGTVTEISELDTAKNGYILLVQDAKPNFKQAGNSPVTPDGWQLVPKEPTAVMNKAGWDAMNEHDAINPTYRAMLAAAPLQAEEPAQKK